MKVLAAQHDNLGTVPTVVKRSGKERGEEGAIERIALSRSIEVR